MSRIVKSKYKASRRLGVNLWGRAKDPVDVKNYPPGIHGPSGRRKVVSDFGKQLVEKQKLKKYYANLNERQFRNVYLQAAKLKGDTGENLIGLLESRLDVVVYRAKFVPTIFAARQFVSHKHVKVNGQTVNISSYRLKEGDVVEVREKSKQLTTVLGATQSAEREVPQYIEVDNNKLTAKFSKIPAFSDVPFPMTIALNLVIEFYSR